jgi:uncharacterized integral membrane protein (TIGR00698 family)
MRSSTLLTPATGSSGPRERSSIAPGLAVTIVGTAAAAAAHALVSQVGTLTWAVLFGALAANLNVLPRSAGQGLKFATKRLLRLGVALLGFSLSLRAIADLGVQVVGMVVVVAGTTLLGTAWLGIRMGIGRPRSILLATGFAICGASALAAMEESAEATEDDVAAAVAMVTLFGSVMMIGLPLLQQPLGLTATQMGAWAGASIHEVGQVLAAADSVGAAALGVAIVVKLSRVLLLAPVVTAANLVQRRRYRAASTGADAVTRPPLVPMFVVGFLGCAIARTAGLVPPDMIQVIGYAQTATLGAAMFGMGAGVRIATLTRSGGPLLVLSTLATAVVTTLSLLGVLVLM